MNTIEQENILAVEGKDEVNFFDALLKTLNISNVQIIDIGGKDNFHNKFTVLIQSDGALEKIRNIGFIRDAEDHEATAAFQSICSILIKHKFPCPAGIGKIIKQDGRKVNIFIMPNNNDCGMLENLCVKSIEETNVFKCVDGFVKCYDKIINKDNYNLPKAQILAYLSTRTPIVYSLGVAAQKNVWDFSHQCYGEIKRFLLELFR